MLSLYIHIPFCVRKCPYCGFYSTQYEASLADRYLEALREELKLRIAMLSGQIIGTIYIGGGTPTTLSFGQLSFLFRNILHDTACLAPDAEVSVEVNPGTASREVFTMLKEQGVTRLSIGVQSFSEEVLALLGRAHRASEAQRAVAMARAAGFSNIGLDLMYAIPGQTSKHWTDTLDCALALGPEHVSLYSLSLDEGSLFARDARCGKLVLPSDETAADLYSTACDRLERNGYQGYELSNFARPGFFCRHNLNYWAWGEYLGLGAAAWSFIGGVRSANIADIAGYISGVCIRASVTSFEERPGPSEAVSESLFLGLRTSEGVDLERFAASFGKAAHGSLLAAIERNRSTGLYDVIGGKLRLTQRGKLLANEAMAALIP